jgi:lipoprotein-anchoring transpeptidase ErfK/SrfK
MRYKIACALAAPLMFFAACSPPASNSRTETIQSPVAAQRITAPMGQFAMEEMTRINGAKFQSSIELAPNIEAIEQNGRTAEAQPAPAPGAPAAEPAANIRYDAALVRIQVLLDRAHFSPGVIDGYNGENVRKAVSAYQQAHDLDVNGQADDALLQRLVNADADAALVSYVITEADVRGPYVDVPAGLEAQSRLEHLGYQNVHEALAERFHMDQDLLQTLNPGADFTQAGTEIVVASAGGDLTGAVASIEIDKQGRNVRAYDGDGQMVAYYPATIGSSDAPAPTGAYEVRAVAFDPTYNYDPERLPTFGDTGHGALQVAGGPNNPVGAVWIALSLDTYGIHGAPDPQQVSKTQSHGCVRLTNWDATELGRAVSRGVPVTFLEASADSRALQAG